MLWGSNPVHKSIAAENEEYHYLSVFSTKAICGHSFESPRQGNSNEYQHYDEQISINTVQLSLSPT